MTGRLANAVLDGAPWINIQHAMGVQVRDFAGPCGALQNSLIRMIEVVSNFADSMHFADGEWPVTFLLELMFFMLDTVIAGPSVGAGALGRKARPRCSGTKRRHRLHGSPLRLAVTTRSERPVWGEEDDDEGLLQRPHLRRRDPRGLCERVHTS